MQKTQFTTFQHIFRVTKKQNPERNYINEGAGLDTGADLLLNAGSVEAAVVCGQWTRGTRLGVLGILDY